MLPPENSLNNVPEVSRTVEGLPPIPVAIPVQVPPVKPSFKFKPIHFVIIISTLLVFVFISYAILNSGITTNTSQNPVTTVTDFFKNLFTGIIHSPGQSTTPDETNGTPLEQTDTTEVAKAITGIADRSIEGIKIGLGTITSENLASTLTFPEGSLLDFSGINYATTSEEGLILPNTSSGSPAGPASGQGYLAWDKLDKQLIVFNGKIWQSVGVGDSSGNIQIANEIAGKKIGFYVADQFTSSSTVTAARYGLTMSPSMGYSVGLSGWGGLSFFTNDSERMRIDSSGNVGIGTLSPGQKLSVASGANMEIAGETAGEKIGFYVADAFNSPSSVSTAKYGLTMSPSSDYSVGLSGWGGLSFFTYNTERVRIDASGNVGIGTTAPASTLSVNGGISAGSYYLTAAPSNGMIISGNVGIANPAPTAKLDITGWNENLARFSLTTDQNTYNLNLSNVVGINSTVDYRFQTNDYTGGTHDVLYFQGASGNVGIGTTLPTQILDVAGTAQMAGFKLTTSPSINYVLTSDINGVGTWQPAAGGGITGSGITNFITKWTTGGSVLGDSIIFDDGTNIGIGNTAPGQKLSVASGSNIEIAGETFGEKIGFYVADAFNSLASVSTARYGLTMGPNADESVGLSGWGGLSFYTLDTERMRIDGFGNVGIGTTSPGSTLGVNGGISVGSYSENAAPAGGMLISGHVGIATLDTTAKLEVAGWGANGEDLARFGLSTQETNYYLDLSNVVGSSVDYRFQTKNYPDAPRDVLYFQGTTGNVGIGTTAPTNLLSVAGNASFIGNVGIGTTTLGANLEVAGTASVSGTLTFSGLKGCSNGLITDADGIVSCSSSDVSLKQNISSISGALDKVLSLQGVSYNWKDKALGSGTEFGLIAQDVAKVVPELTFTEGSGVMGVKYDKAVALLIEAIKSQQDEINSMKVLGTSTVATDSATFSNLNVLDKTLMGDTVVSGALNVGGLTVDGQKNSIDAIGTLNIQSLSLGSVQFEGESIEMDQNGNLNIKKGVIIGNDQMRGSATLNAGQTSVTVGRNWTSVPATIVVTPGYNTSVWVGDKSQNGFTINVSTAPSAIMTVDWLAIW